MLYTISALNLLFALCLALTMIIQGPIGATFFFGAFVFGYIDVILIVVLIIKYFTKCIKK